MSNNYAEYYNYIGRTFWLDAFGVATILKYEPLIDGMLIKHYRDQWQSNTRVQIFRQGEMSLFDTLRKDSSIVKEIINKDDEVLEVLYE